MAPAARASQPGYTGVTVYVDEDIWKQLRRYALDNEVTASSVGAALLEQYVAGGIDQAPVLARAREITVGRRRRAES